MQGQEKVFLSRHNKVWENIKTNEILGDKLTLKPGEKLTNYRQIPKPAELSAEQPKPKSGKNQDYFSPKENKGVFGE